mmetsp:Transcript_4981/g.10991  ORF Transcript_4981/g.10991 Transcript_4981/m.10991 type:complete len:92 (-) Transcript_4981:388-663(-)
MACSVLEKPLMLRLRYLTTSLTDQRSTTRAGGSRGFGSTSRGLSELARKVCLLRRELVCAVVGDCLIPAKEISEKTLTRPAVPVRSETENR